MTIRDVTYTNDFCRLVLNKPFGNATGGSTRTAGTPPTGMETPYGSAFEIDFTNGILDPRVTFSRASNGTYFDSNGILKTATINEPRFTYDPWTKRPLGLIVEGGSLFDFHTTGLALNNPSTFNGVFTSTTSAINPANQSTTEARTFNYNTTAITQHYLTYNFSSSNASAVFSMFFKLITGPIYPVLILDDGGANGIWASFDLSTGTVLQQGTNGASVLEEAGVQKLPNGWCRCWIGGQKIVAGNWARAGITSTESTTGSQWYPSYAGTSGRLFAMYGKQVESSGSITHPTSYNITSTRVTDLCHISSSVFNNVYNREEGTLLCEFNPQISEATVRQRATSGSLATDVPIFGIAPQGLSLFSAQEFMLVRINNTINTVSHQYSFFTQTLQPNTNSSTYTNDSTLGGFAPVSLTGGTASRIAFSYKQGTKRISMNGNTVLGVSGHTPQRFYSNNSILIGGDSFGTGGGSGHCISRIRYYPRFFEESQLRQLTSSREL